MKRQRNTTQIKEQTRNTEIQINEKELGKLPGKEFRITTSLLSHAHQRKKEQTNKQTNKNQQKS